MSELFGAFGLDWRVLVINLINFGVLLLVLWYFLYGPMMRMLEERRTKIAKGLDDAERAAQELGKIEESRSAALAEAGKEADNVIAEARQSATQKQRELIERGESAAESIISDAEREAEELKNRALQESKEETAKLIVLGAEKVLSQK